MKLWPILAMVVGIAAVIGLIGYFGAGEVGRSLLAVGPLGFMAVCVVHIVLIAVMGVAWGALLGGGAVWVPIWGRFVRDSGSEALPLSQVGGYVLGARALALVGVSGTVAAASTIVDVTLEFFSQLVYTAIGLACLVQLQPSSAAALPVTIGLVVAAVACALFILAQRHGLGYVDRLAQFLGQGWAERTAAGAAALHAALLAIYRRQAGLWVCFLLHLLCWVASAGEIWIALRFTGEALPFPAVLAIEAVLYAVRAVAFLVPNAIGIQEGTYILLGATFGLSPEMALALSLLKRARDLVIGLPVLAAWQTLEGRRMLRRRAT